MNTILLYAGSALTIAWGVAHLFPTRNVVRGFGSISADNQRIITMEWIIEGATLIFTGTLTGIAAYADHSAWISKLVFLLAALFLIALAVISLFTGFRVRFLPFRLCPLIFGVSAVLIFMGGIYLNEDAPGRPSREALSEEIRQVEKDFAEMAAEEGVSEAFLYFAAEEAVMNRNDTIIKGKNAFYAYFLNQKMKDVRLTWVPDFIDVSASGDMAYTYGEYTLRATDPDGQEIVAKGIFHTVWKRQADGSWKFVYD